MIWSISVGEIVELFLSAGAVLYSLGILCQRLQENTEDLKGIRDDIRVITTTQISIGRHDERIRFLERERKFTE